MAAENYFESAFTIGSLANVEECMSTTQREHIEMTLPAFRAGAQTFQLLIQRMENNTFESKLKKDQPDSVKKLIFFKFLVYLPNFLYSSA
jgi:hypothetical protein